MSESHQMSRKLAMILEELVATETSYIADLDRVLTGYREFFDAYSGDKVFALLRNSLQKLVEFSEGLLTDIKLVEGDAVKICQVFSTKSADFNEHYGNYCDVYPMVMTILENMDPASSIAELIAECKLEAKFALPLGSYLLKPVQRVLKYHLLLNTVRKVDCFTEEEKEVVQACVDRMKSVNFTINERKRIQEGYAQLPLLKAKIVNLKGGLNFELVGPVVMQCNMKVNGKKRHVVLFENAVLIMKITEDDDYIVMEGLGMCNLILSERNTKSEFSFDIREHLSSKIQYTLALKNLDTKEQWMLHIKRLILQNMKVNLNEQKLAALFGENVGNKIQTLLSAHDLVSFESHISTSRPKVLSAEESVASDLKPANGQGKDGMVRKRCGKLFDLEKLFTKPDADVRGSYCTIKTKQKNVAGDTGSDSVCKNVSDCAKNHSASSSFFTESNVQGKGTLCGDQTLDVKATNPDANENEERNRTKSTNPMALRESNNFVQGKREAYLTESVTRHESLIRPVSCEKGRGSETSGTETFPSSQDKPPLPTKSSFVKKHCIRPDSLPSSTKNYNPGDSTSAFHHKNIVSIRRSRIIKSKPHKIGGPDLNVEDYAGVNVLRSHTADCTVINTEFGFLKRGERKETNPPSSLSSNSPPAPSRSSHKVLPGVNKLVDKTSEGHDQSPDSHVGGEPVEKFRRIPSIGVSISKASRIGNILQQLQQQCMISETKFKSPSNIIKVGKMGVSVTDLPDQTDVSQQPPSKGDLTRPDS